MIDTYHISLIKAEYYKIEIDKMGCLKEPHCS